VFPSESQHESCRISFEIQERVVPGRRLMVSHLTAENKFVSYLRIFRTMSVLLFFGCEKETPSLSKVVGGFFGSK